MQVPQQVPHLNFLEPGRAEPNRISREPVEAGPPGYNRSVEIRLRDFRHSDFEVLWRIDQQCFASGISYSRVELAAYLRRPGAFAVVAESGAELSAAGKAAAPGRDELADESTLSTLGFIVAESGSRGSGHIITLDVVPAARRARVGSRLLHAAQDRLRAADCHSVFLETAVDNLSALAFYKKHGYSVTKTVPRYYSDGVDALVMKKDLLSPSQPAKLPR